MSPFSYRDGQLCAEGLPLRDIAARFGTPCYVYSRAEIESQWRAYDEAFAEQPHLVCYAVKANGNLGILGVLARLGSGFDIVSGGELERVLRAGGEPARIVFSGVGKSSTELQRALDTGVRCLNVESLSELKRLEAVAAAAGRQARVALRVNPEVDAGTHPYIATALRRSKFGIRMRDAVEVYEASRSMPHLDVVGIACHIGSQITSLAPGLAALDKVLELVADLRRRGAAIAHLDVGGGLGIRYRDEQPPSPAQLVAALRARLEKHDLEIVVEPGRSIVGNAGVLLTRVEYLKPGEEHDFAVVDAAMNDLLRPALYEAWQDILPVAQGSRAVARTYDVVGPVCESADFLGLQRELAIAEGDLLAVAGCGAYGACMSSNYNGRPRPAEILVDNGTARPVRQRETLQDMLALENVPV